jgi:glucose-6-phosphate-specific signal transduction histidine kinase
MSDQQQAMQRRLADLKETARNNLMSELLDRAVQKAADAQAQAQLMTESARQLDQSLTAANETIEKLTRQLADAQKKLARRGVKEVV